MRPRGRSQYDSLYFHYPEFDAPPPTRGHAGETASVVIVGAGPVGLTAALALAADGIPSLVIEAGSTFNDGSRAICLSRSSFHILESIGAVQPFLGKALPWTHGRTFYRGQQILEFAMPDRADDKYRPMYNLQQQYIEAYLYEAVAASGHIEVRWQSTVMAVDDAPGGGVSVQVRDGHGDYTLSADWLLAADGARSAIRQYRGLRLEGENFEGRYVIADVRMAHDYPTVRRALFDPPGRRGGTVLVHRQPDDIWRIDYQLRDGEDPDAAIEEGNIRASVAAILQDIGHQGDWALEWWSIYSANTLALPDYRDGRVFFIGDSAHIVPIFGVRGLNNGLADAQNIAWKLARVIRGEAQEHLLDSYTPERRGATLDVFANASRSTRFMTPPTRGWRLLRDASLSLALRHDFAGAFANPRQMAPYTYRDSPLTRTDDEAFDGGPPPGSFFVDAALGDGFLSDRLQAGFNVVWFGVADAIAGSQDADLRDAGESNDAESGTWHDIVVPADGALAGLYAASEGSAYLLRPDLHVAARWRQAERSAIRRTLSQLLSGDIGTTGGAGDALRADETSYPSLDDVYDRLARATDSAGAARESVLLAKIGLLLAEALGDPRRVLALIDDAENDLE